MHFLNLWAHLDSAVKYTHEFQVYTLSHMSNRLWERHKGSSNLIFREIGNTLL